MAGDGVCNLCNVAVNAIIDRDPRAVFRFASLQSEPATRLLAQLGVGPIAGDPSSVLLVEGGRVYDRSTAVLRIARRLGGVCWLLVPFFVVPKSIRDAAYGFIARHRYRWFGKSEVCRVPTKELRDRFL